MKNVLIISTSLRGGSNSVLLAKECAKGKSRKSCDLNAYIEEARIKLHQTFNELEKQGQFITARLLQEKFFGQDQVPEVVRTLIQTIQEHNEQCR